MITRICEGISQTQHVVTAHRHHPLSAVPGQIRLAYATQDQMGVDVGGSTHYPTLLFELQRRDKSLASRYPLPEPYAL
jgi:hypothetical protein